MIKLRFYSRTIFLRLVFFLSVGIHIAWASPLPAAQSRVQELVDSLSLEQLMSLEINSTSFFDTPIEKTPGSLYIIPGETLDFSYSVSLADYLAFYVPGAHISEFYEKGPLYSTRGISGGSNTTALFMLNSEILNTSSGMPSNLNLPLLGYADRVEVLNGPCSLLHGSGAVNGFINIVHKNGRDHQGPFFSMESGLESGQVRVETGHGILDPNFGDLYLYLGMVDSDPLDRPSKQADAFNDPSFRTSVNWRRNGVSIVAFAQQEGFQSALASPMTHTDQGYPNLSMDNYAIIPEVRFDLTDTEDITLSLPLKYAKESQISDDAGRISQVDKEHQFKGKLLLRTTRMDGHRIALGGSVSLYKRKSNSRIPDMFIMDAPDTPQGLLDISLDLSWLEWSAFVEDTVQLTDRTSLFAGLRFDSLQAEDFLMTIDQGPAKAVELGGSYARELTPRIGITYALTPARLLKFMYQQGYHYPDFAGRITANATRETATEKVQSFEVGYHHAFPGSQGEFNLNAYYNIFSDTTLQILTQDGSGHEIPVPSIADRFAAAGFEATVAFFPFKNTKIEASYAYSRPCNIRQNQGSFGLTNPDGNKWLIYPAHTIKLNLTRKLLQNRLELALGCLYNNSISTLAGQNIDPNQSRNDVFDHHRIVVNAAARYRLTPNIYITVRGKNILDNDVPATGYYYDWGYQASNTSYVRPAVFFGLDWKF